MEAATSLAMRVAHAVLCQEPRTARRSTRKTVSIGRYSLRFGLARAVIRPHARASAPPVLLLKKFDQFTRQPSRFPSVSFIPSLLKSAAYE